jgi:hypothetical protein
MTRAPLQIDFRERFCVAFRERFCVLIFEKDFALPASAFKGTLTLTLTFVY